MNNYQKLYWLTRLDYLQGTCLWFLFISTVAFCVIMAIYSDAYDTEKKEAKKYKTIALSIFIISLVGTIFIPSKNEVIFIFAGGKTMDFIQSDTSINKIPAQTTKLITDYLDNQIKEIEK